MMFNAPIMEMTTSAISRERLYNSITVYPLQETHGFGNTSDVYKPLPGPVPKSPTQWTLES